MVEEKRGKGAPKGRRSVIWVCSGVTGCTCGNAQLKTEKIAVQDQEPDSDQGSFPKEIAEKQFTNKYNMVPQIILGPMYEKKGQNKIVNKRATISRDISDMRLCRKRQQCHGIWEGWHGIANYIENDNEKVYFCFVREENPQPGKSKKIPSPGKVNIEDLVFEDNLIENNT